MQLYTICGCLVLVVLAIVCSPVDSGTSLSQRRSTTPLPAKKERLPYTPVKDSTRKERLPYTPVKPPTPAPYGLRPRTTTTKRVPFPVKTTAKTSPCNCNCNLTVGSPVCGGSGAEQETFANQCQLDCYNCTHNKRYRVIKNGECSK